MNEGFPPEWFVKSKETAARVKLMEEIQKLSLKFNVEPDLHQLDTRCFKSLFHFSNKLYKKNEKELKISSFGTGITRPKSARLKTAEQMDKQTSESDKLWIKARELGFLKRQLDMEGNEVHINDEQRWFCYELQKEKDKHYCVKDMKKLLQPGRKPRPFVPKIGTVQSSSNVTQRDEKEEPRDES
jgi:hypothetical protein